MTATLMPYGSQSYAPLVAKVCKSVRKLMPYGAKQYGPLLAKVGPGGGKLMPYGAEDNGLLVAKAATVGGGKQARVCAQREPRVRVVRLNAGRG